MRIPFFLIFFLFNLLQIFSQSKKITENIGKLDNSQFIIDHSVKAGFSMKSQPAIKLIRSGKKASAPLITALDDPNKGIMAHLILCHIYFKQVTFAGPKTFVSDKGDVLKYFLGQQNGEGLIISEINNKKYIENYDLEKIKRFWEKKVKEKTTQTREKEASAQ